MNLTSLASTMVILGLSVAPAMADLQTQNFGPTGPNTALGLTPFNSALGTLDSVTLSASWSGTIPQLYQETNGNEVAVSINGSAVLSGFIFCSGSQSPSVCIYTNADSMSTSLPLTGFESPFSSSWGYLVEGYSPSLSASGTLTYNYTPASPSAVPEPASWGLLLTAIVAYWMIRRRRTEQV